MKILNYSLLISLFSFIFTSVIFSQQYLTDVQYYGIEEGLSHSQVLDVHKDENDMMWVLAKDKINRFDGSNFKGFSSGKLFHPFAKIIGEDATNDIWIADAFEKGGIVFFNSKTETFQTPEEKFAGITGLNNISTSFYFTSPTGDWYFGNRVGKLWRYHPKTNEIKETAFGKKDLVLPFFENSEGVIWVNVIKNRVGYHGNSDLVAIDKNGAIVHKIEIDEVAINFNKIGNKEFSFSTFEEFYTVDEFGKTTKYPLSKFSKRPDRTSGTTKFHYITYDEKFDQYWMKNELGELLVFHPEKGLLQNLTNLFGEVNRGNYKGMFIDEKGMAWMATMNGMYKFKCQKNDFQQFLKNEKSELVSCRSIVTNSQGDIFINSDKGIFSIKNKKSIAGEQKIITQEIQRERYNFLASYMDFKDDFWTELKDSLTIIRDGKIVESWRIPSGYSWSMLKSEKRFWLSLTNRDTSLLSIDLATRAIKIFDQYNGFDVLKKSDIYSIQKSSEGLWLVTGKGLFVLDENNGIQARYWKGGKGKYQLPVDDLRHLHEDKNGIIWLASSQGLVQWDKEKNTHQVFTTEDGLSHNNIYAVYEDDFGFLWMSSDNGIIQFQKSTQQVKNHLLSDGISHHEFNRISHLQVNNSKDLEQNGMIYFGGLNGVTAFHPKDFAERFDVQPDIPIVLLEGKIYRKKTNQVEDVLQNFTNRKSIVINPGDQALNLEFALLDYENPKLVQYEYQIKGINEHWNLLKNNTLIVSGLSYGNQELSIRAKTGNGDYSLQELQLPIQVLRPFYLQGWFAILSVGILGLMIFGFYTWRTNELRMQKILLEKEVQERTKTIGAQAEELRNLDKVKSRFFANISHELRTPLTLILAPLNSILKRNKIANEDTQLVSMAHENAQKLLGLTNEILDLTKLEANKMELNESPVFILKETRQIFSNFETQAFQLGINFQFLNTINPELQIQLDKNKFEKILNNLLLNALNFTPKGGKVILHLENGGTEIRLKVEDSGKGISPNDLPHIFERFYQSKEKDASTDGGTGIGLALCKEFSKLFNGKIWAESELGKGSIFSFEFPKKEVKISKEIFPKETTPAIEENNNNAIPALVEEFKSSILEKEILDGEQPTILVVEDNFDLRNFLKLILQKKYKVRLAENGAEAWSILQKNKNIQLILSDVMMPVMDGFQLLEKVKSEQKLASIPMVMLTAKVALEDKLKALRIGVDDYILKPFEEEELLVRIQNLLKNAALRKVYQKEEMMEIAEVMPSLDSTIALNDFDRNWLFQIEAKVLSNISSFEFNAEVLAQIIFLSRRQLDRRLKVLTGLTTGEYIREARMQEARKLIEARTFQSIKEVAFEIGIKSHSYFSKQYKTRFGKSPAELLK